jgi:hypothetical protein
MVPPQQIVGNQRRANVGRELGRMNLVQEYGFAIHRVN